MIKDLGKNIEIFQVQNGWVIRPSHDFNSGMVRSDTAFVASSQPELIKIIAGWAMEMANG